MVFVEPMQHEFVQHTEHMKMNSRKRHLLFTRFILLQQRISKLMCGHNKASQRRLQATEDEVCMEAKQIHIALPTSMIHAEERAVQQALPETP